MQKRLIIFSGFSGAIAVAIGAMAAHFLKSKIETGLITENNIHAIDTAARYQIVHSVALLAIAILLDRINSHLLPKAAYCFMIGIICFSGSLYFLSTAGLIGITYIHWLGIITPIGGLFFISGWLLLAFSATKFKKTK